jgi:uridine phosphorylase
MPGGPILPTVPTVLRPTAPVAADVLLPGDPGRALALAQELLVAPRMSNHAHGLWGYSGETPDGRPLTIQSTGIGAPSAAHVLGDLAELGARRAVRVGTCVALDGGLELGATLLCGRAIAADGTSRALGAAPAAEPDAGLTASLAGLPGAPERSATVVSADVIREAGSPAVPAALRERWLADGAVAAELQMAALFALGDRLRVGVAGLLVVADDAQGRAGDDTTLAEATTAAAALAARALADGARA